MRHVKTLSTQQAFPFKRYAVLTSSHSVAPTLPYSPALQLANTRLLLGLNPSIDDMTLLALQSSVPSPTNCCLYSILFLFLTILDHFMKSFGQLHQY